MKKEFRLQKVLEHRERVVEIEKGKLADLRLERRKYEENMEKIQAEIEAKQNDIEEQKRAGNLNFIRMYHDYIVKLKHDRVSTRKVLDEFDKKIDEQQKVVIEAINNHKIMIKLKDKHTSEYIKYLDKEERKMLDELVISRRGMNE